MKINCIVFLVILTITTVKWTVNKTVDLGGDGTQDFKLNYLDNPGSSLLYLEFAPQISQALQFYQTATAICFNKQDGATDIQEGDNGFGIMFACYLKDGCYY